jgi:hypothetical protein
MDHFFRLLARCDASFDQWYRAGRAPRGVPGRPVRTDHVEELERQLERDKRRASIGKTDNAWRGYSVHAWNRAGSATSFVRIKCGYTSRGVPNSCIVQPCSTGEDAERLMNAPVLTQVLTCMVEAWDPDSGVINSSEHLIQVPKADPWEPDVGWVTYLSHRLGTVPPLPAPVRIEPVGSEGTLILLTPERFTVSNPEHVALAARVRELLGRAGLLRARS